MDHRTLEQRARAFEYVFDAVVVTDLEGFIVDWNAGAERLYGWSREEAVGQPVSILHVKDELDRTADVLTAVEEKGKWTGEIKMLHRDGTIGWIESVVVPLLDNEGRPCGALGINRDITRRVQNEEDLVRLATTDSLTGLPNRGLLLDRLEGTFRRAERQLHCFALLFIDLDDFKEINDRGGHLAGDQVLKEVARDLATELRDSDTVARIGGDEFAVLIEDCSGINDARDVGATVLLPGQTVRRNRRYPVSDYGQYRGRGLPRQWQRCFDTSRPRRRGHVPGQGHGRQLVRITSD